MKIESLYKDFMNTEDLIIFPSKINKHSIMLNNFKNTVCFLIPMYRSKVHSSCGPTLQSCLHTSLVHLKYSMLPRILDSTVPRIIWWVYELGWLPPVRAFPGIFPSQRGSSVLSPSLALVTVAHQSFRRI